MNFARLEDATDENMSAWRHSHEMDLPTYRGNGCSYHESLGRASTLSTWDGPIVARCNAMDWQNAVSCEWRSTHRLGTEDGRRFVDYSDMIPSSSRTLRLFADNRIPPGFCIIESTDGQQLVLVIW